MKQCPPDIVLENHHNHENDRGEKIAQEPVQGMQVADPRGNVDSQDNRQSQQHLDRPGTLDQQDDPVDDKSYNADVNKVEKTNLVQDIQHLLLRKRQTSALVTVQQCLVASASLGGLHHPGQQSGVH